MSCGRSDVTEKHPNLEVLTGATAPAQSQRWRDRASGESTDCPAITASPAPGDARARGFSCGANSCFVVRMTWLRRAPGRLLSLVDAIVNVLEFAGSQRVRGSNALSWASTSPSTFGRSHDSRTVGTARSRPPLQANRTGERARAPGRRRPREESASDLPPL